MCAGRTVIPMKLLKELALGNIRPMVRNFKKDSVYAKMLAEVTARQEKLIETLSPEQKALFDAASQAEIDLSVENDHDLFVKGFVLGAQMMLEFLTDGRPDGGCGQVSRDGRTIRSVVSKSIKTTFETPSSFARPYLRHGKRTGKTVRRTDGKASLYAPSGRFGRGTRSGRATIPPSESPSTTPP